ncbi:uncharacterized protein MELLADRAFT_108084 [Melampsora larici-populina 98AG31]|uniref:Glucose receptor Git3 N-terminal domain-containing protein n=1 Tax=Melampsora larici-populina (strain 98AG31 / pathotype 3-4-7) TaxID=747676 RepID=F4RRX2_MELLP|nr:uncharacterized protein MELLADRAFT_108084 [Melampsora larici-populina 98AG31]EGG04753.1 hypothetical protein MELLADRAFT_108084 [Melampsora larici-populina 98AG31]
MSGSLRYNASQPSLSSHEKQEIGIDRIGLLLIAGAATVSLLATTGLLVYVIVLKILAGRPSTLAWASLRLAFMGTTFGPLFINLTVADFIQAFGLMHNYFGLDLSAQGSEPLCTSQGFMVQLGDVASALMSLLISVETFVILSKSDSPRSGSLWAAALIWLMCVSFSSKGLLNPPNLDYSAPGTWTGGWCWIAFEGQGARVIFHQMWLWLTAIVSTILYVVLYFRIRGHYRGEGHVLQRSSIIIPTQDSASDFSQNSSRSNSSSLRRVAWTMLVYPVIFFVFSIPISLLSIITLDDAKYLPWRNTLLTIFGSLFALRGLINVLVFGFTRNVFLLRAPPPSRKYSDPFVPPSPSGSKHTLRLSFESDLGQVPMGASSGIYVTQVQVIYPSSEIGDHQSIDEEEHSNEKDQKHQV